MSGHADDDWGRPIDLMVDSDAPEQIALELGRRHALYLREAQRLVLEGAHARRGRPRRRGSGPRPLATCARIRGSPHADARARGDGRRGAHAGRASRRSSPPHRPPRRRRRRAAPRDRSGGSRCSRRRRSSATWPSASSRPSDGLELAWDAAPQVIEWVLRVSVRPDPRQDYVEGEAETLPAGDELVRGRARRAPAPDPALRPCPRRQHRASRGHLGADERQQRRAVEAAGDRELEPTGRIDRGHGPDPVADDEREATAAGRRSRTTRARRGRRGRSARGSRARPDAGASTHRCPHARASPRRPASRPRC